MRLHERFKVALVSAAFACACYGALASALLLSDCGGKNAPLVAAQGSHDVLKTAFDLEAQLCWGVPTAAQGPSAPAARQHCTSPLAAQAKLTDVRHIHISALFEQAFLAHQTATAAAQTAASADFSTFNGLLQAILAVLTELEQNTQVTQLSSAVASAKR